MLCKGAWKPADSTNSQRHIVRAIGGKGKPLGNRAETLTAVGKRLQIEKGSAYNVGTIMGGRGGRVTLILNTVLGATLQCSGGRNFGAGAEDLRWQAHLLAFQFLTTSL